MLWSISFEVLSRPLKVCFQLPQFLKTGIIEPSYSSWSRPLLLIPKLPSEYRMVNDYCQLNKITIKDRYRLPNYNSCLDLLSRAKYYIVLDMTDAFRQTPLEKSSGTESAFITSTGLYEYKCIPQGLCKSPATFQRLADPILAGSKLCWWYFSY